MLRRRRPDRHCCSPPTTGPASRRARLARLRRSSPAACPAPRLLAHGRPGAVRGDGEARLHEREHPRVGEERVPSLLEGGRVRVGGLLDRSAEVAHRAEVVVSHERERPRVGEERIPALPDGVRLRAAASPPRRCRGLRRGAHELGLFSPCIAVTGRPQGIPRLPQLCVLVPCHLTGRVILHPAALCRRRIRALRGCRPRRAGGPREPAGFVWLSTTGTFFVRLVAPACSNIDSSARLAQNARIVSVFYRHAGSRSDKL
ncbi:hypothetical protein C2845_PM12G16310 [Panicum miliaceum]|uniref:Uncharacterized protein n=1 Tax=Panicum miliaceum TaxID=4540 RepID=A0A3L6QH23_PANMI|nr:hypothetical protein C2845_PM12G16310 [Panicum miliaceum]